MVEHALLPETVESSNQFEARVVESVGEGLDRDVEVGRGIVEPLGNVDGNVVTFGGAVGVALMLVRAYGDARTGAQWCEFLGEFVSVQWVK